MKKLLLAVLALMVFCTNSYAEGPKLKIKISGSTKNDYFLCLYNIGCISMKIANDKSHAYPISANDIQNLNKVVIANINNKRIYKQSLANSCNVKVNENQNITIYGQLTTKNAAPYINNLHCTISNA